VVEVRRKIIDSEQITGTATNIKAGDIKAMLMPGPE